MSPISFELLRLDDVPETFDFGRKEFSFVYLERSTGMFQACQYIINMVDIVFDRV